MLQAPKGEPGRTITIQQSQGVRLARKYLVNRFNFPPFIRHITPDYLNYTRYSKFCSQCTSIGSLIFRQGIRITQTVKIIVLKCIHQRIRKTFPTIPIRNAVCSKAVIITCPGDMDCDGPMYSCLQTPEMVFSNPMDISNMMFC